MKRLKTLLLPVGIIFFSIITLSLSSCATTRQSKLETQRQGYMLLHKSEYSRNKGKFRDTRTPRSLKKARKNMRKGRR